VRQTVERNKAFLNTSAEWKALLQERSPEMRNQLGCCLSHARCIWYGQA
jgi:hypothetical protein